MSYVTVVEVQKSRLQTLGQEVCTGCSAGNTYNVVHHGETYEMSRPVTAQLPNMNLKNANQRNEKPKACESWPSITDSHESNNRPTRRPSIRDQNVGVAGSVLMVSDPLYHHPLSTLLWSSSDDEVKPPSTSSLSSLSESDSDFSTTIAVVGAKDTNFLLNAGCETKQHESGINRQNNCEKPTSGIPEPPEIPDVSPPAEVPMEWKVTANSPPHLQPVLIPVEVDTDRGSTPASFSSAYTVTEHGSGSTSEDSEASRHNWSCPESDDESHLVPNGNEMDSDALAMPNLCEVSARRMNGHHSLLQKSNISLLKFCGTSQLKCHTDPESPQMAQMNERVGEDLEEADIMSGFRRVGEDWMLRRLRHLSEGSDSSCSSGSSSGRSIVYSYIPCRDQNEREDEELWVANEAADPGGVHSFQGPAPPLLPPCGWGGSLGRGSGKRRPVLGEQLRAAHGSVAPPSCVASLMCTITPSPAILAPGVGGSPTPSKHYSTRQRASEIQTIKFAEEEPKYRRSWNELHNTDSRQASENIVMQTSTATNMPTKRFSFLIRSNSVKQEAPAATQQQPVTPSDQAILDKLATLSLQAPEVVVKPQTKCSLFTPPCARCGESVYPQERVEPTLRLVYHSACFKCYHCGLRLTLKTFFRSPLDSKDSRVFCKSHVPALDPGRVSVAVSCSSHASRTLPRENTSSLHRSASTSLLRGQLDIVKCDTIGLRYL